MRDGYIPKEERKTILLLSDDIRTHSGVGVMSREIVEGTCHRFNWIQVGASGQSAEAGKILNLSESVQEVTGVEDARVIIYPFVGYGNSRLIRALLEKDKPDAILHFTDPRYWTWLYSIEHEIRQQIPIFYYSVWDAMPYPMYNEGFYRSSDWIGAISKQTYNLTKHVSKIEPRKEWSLTYLPHGINPTRFFPIAGEEVDTIIPSTTPAEEGSVAVELTNGQKLEEFKKTLFNGDDVDFSALFISRNIHRKHPGDIILAFKYFLSKLTPEQADRCRLVMHTAPVDGHGTDLPATLRDVAPNVRTIFTKTLVPSEQINLLYNTVDVTVNLSSNEGFGLGTCESIMAGTPIIVNVTGGLQDQCGFKDEHGNYLDADEHYSFDWGSNNDGKYKAHGEWAFPVFPPFLSLQGSPATPYIYDERCDWKDAGERLLELYHMTKEERKRRGALGREFALNEGRFSSPVMCSQFITDMERAWDNYSPRKKFTLLKV